MPRILRAQELADALHVSLQLIYKWRRIKAVPSMQIGDTIMFDFDEVIKALPRFGPETTTPL